MIDDGYLRLAREKRLRNRQLSEGFSRRRFRFGSYRRLDRTEAEGVELRSGTFVSGGLRGSPPRYQPLRNGDPRRNYGAIGRRSRRPLLPDALQEGVEESRDTDSTVPTNNGFALDSEPKVSSSAPSRQS